MFKTFGLNLDDVHRATSLIGELGNNVFDHNLGNWPIDIRGCFIVGQNYQKEKKLEMVVGDPGVGFLGSLKNAFPELHHDVEAIVKGLEGNTGREGEKRGNGLKLIQDWVINNFSGYLTIHSKSGLVVVDRTGREKKEVFEILGTIVQFVIYYN